jgi:hypothetical protein
VKALGKAAVAENVNDSMEYGSSNLHGRLMLFAAQLQAAGETESANSLAAALFRVAENDAALIIELASKPMLAYTLNQFAEAEGSADAVMAFVRKRVAAWSSGEKPEEWPSSDNVSEERVEEISTKLAALKADEIIPYAKSLPVSERYALVDIVSGFDEEETLPEGLRKLRVTLKPSSPSSIRVTTPTPPYAVKPPAPVSENDNLSADPAFLEALATSTGGTLIPRDGYEAFLEKVFTPAPPTARSAGAIWQASWLHWPLALLITLPLAIEWYLRRRQGVA